MAKFIVIDHSLKDVGGHHYDYAIQILGAADSLGYETVLASNRKFRGRRELPEGCRVFPIFRYDTYGIYTTFSGDQHWRDSPLGPSQAPPTTFGLGSLWHVIGEFRARRLHLRRRLRRQRRIDHFVNCCRQLFRQLRPEPGDQVFLPTASEFDVLALATFLASAPETKRLDWHVQIHFSFLEGRPPDYDTQLDKIKYLRERFDEALRLAPHHRLHFYNTSLELNDQYNRLGSIPFQNLAYPINSAFSREGAGRVAEGPLRITCAGGLREEKGYNGLAGVVQSLWHDCLSPGKAQLLVQTKRRHGTNAPKLQLPLPDAERSPRAVVRMPTDVASDPVVYIQHPLAIADYVDLIRRADIGLMLYDSRRYYARRAGILGEYLAFGVPVIVPAGCWLAEQIAEPTYRHQTELENRLPLVGQLAPGELLWQSAADAQKLISRSDTVVHCGGASAAIECRLKAPAGARELLASFEWTPHTAPGFYLKLQAEQFATDGRSLGSFTTIVGQRGPSQRVPVLFHLKANVAAVRLACSNAYHDTSLALRGFRVSWLGANGTAASVPAGAVGLIAADVEQAGELVREMCDHYDHYRRSAEAFSHHWFALHDPRRTIAQLASSTRSANALARAA